MKPELQQLDNEIDNFMDRVVKKIDGLDKSNPVFQKKMYQAVSDVTKERDEFLMALRRTVSALDLGAKVLPSSRGTTSQFSKDNAAIVTTDEPEPEPKEEEPSPEKEKEE